jgi:hypothetical protein
MLKSIGSETRIIPLFQVEELSLKIVPERINGDEAVVLALKTGSTADCSKVWFPVTVSVATELPPGKLGKKLLPVSASEPELLTLAVGRYWAWASELQIKRTKAKASKILSCFTEPIPVG